MGVNLRLPAMQTVQRGKQQYSESSPGLFQLKEPAQSKQSEDLTLLHVVVSMDLRGGAVW